MKGKSYFLLVCCFIVFLFITTMAWAVPGVINYQGKLTNPDGTSVDNGTYTIHFRIYNVSSGGTALWSETQSVPVMDGIYNVTLGSVTPIPTAILENPVLYLGVTVEADSEMIPRQEITSTFYALKAGDADTISGQTLSDLDSAYVNENQANSITSAMIQDSTITAADLANNSVGAGEIAAGAVGASEIADGSVTAADLHDGAALAEILDDDGPGSGLNADLLDNFDSSYFMPASTDLWVNTTGDTMTGRLTVNTTGNSIIVDANPAAMPVYGVKVNADQNADNNYSVYGLYSQTNSLASSTGTYGTYSNANGNSNTYGVYSVASSKTGPAYGLLGNTSLPSGNTHNSYGVAANGSTSGSGTVYGTYDTAYHYGTSGTAYGTYSYAAGSDTGTAYGIFAYAHKASSDTGGIAYGGHFTGDNDYSSGASYGVYARATGTGGFNYGVYASASGGTNNYAGYFLASSGTGVYATTTARNKHAGEFSSSSSVGLSGAVLYARAFNTTNEGIAFWAHNDHSTSTDATAVLSNDGSGPLLKGFGGNGGEDEFRFDNDGGLRIYDSDHTQIFYMDPNEDSNGGSFKLYNSHGDLTIELDSGYAGPDGRIITDELMITGGSDLSEQFDVAKHMNPVPGMLVSIDPDRPGKLRVTSVAYDKKVAGVISGAGGIKPGMMMGQRGTKADGALPVALTGRVYCMAVASNGAIEPGDMLTSSNVPGYAMKVTDHAKAAGAIIGKAMTSLKKGRGLVLVLVTLQ